MTGARPVGSRRYRRTLAAALSAAVIGLAFASSSASAASTHPLKEEWSTGSNCSPEEVATDAVGNVYVACSAVGTNEKIGSIRKFSPTGVPIPFTASVFYVSGNEINENPVSPGAYGGKPYEIGSQIFLDVDRSSSVRSGYIYMAALGNVDIFSPTGKYVTSVKGDYLYGEPSGVGIDDKGFVYVLFEGCCGRAHVSKYDPVSYQEIKRILVTRDETLSVEFHGPCCTRIRPDNTGAVWAGWGGVYFNGNGSFGKYEAYEFNDNLDTGSGGKNANAAVGTTSPFLKEAFPTVNCPERWPSNAGPYPCSLKGGSFDVDLSNNDVYAQEGNKIVPYSQGVVGDPVHQDGPSFGEGIFGSSGRGVEIDKDGNVYTTAATNKVVKFSKGDILPTVTTKPAPITDLGHTTATVRGLIDPAGGGEITDCKVKFGTTTAYTAAGSPVSCSQATPYPGGSPTEVSAVLPGLAVGTSYNYRFEASNAKGSNIGGNRRLEAKAVLQLETKPATGIDEHNGTLNGQLDTDGLATTYYFDYGLTAGYGLKTETLPIAGGAGEIKSTPSVLGHLQRGKQYHYRLVATNSLGTTKGTDQIFRTASAPEISGNGATDVTDTTAVLHATINPVGFPTTYRFDFGPSPSFGESLPVGGGELTGNTPQNVSVQLAGLPPSTTIHYRVVAENTWGTSTTDDTTFNFRPTPCPNSHVRQLTGASYLPDCRAYEIVSPGEAGAVQLMPGEGFRVFTETFGGSDFAQAPQNFGYASSPSRFVFWGALGSLKGIEAPNTLIDIYMATRTNKGWVQTMPGLKGNETKYTYGRQCSDSLDLCLDHIGGLYVVNPETNESENVPKSRAPFLYKADGTRLGRLPTNVGVVKNGSKFRGDLQPSGDFSHFFFSTQTPFTPDGADTAPGSVYDNDIAAKTVTVISKLPNGEPIPVQPAGASDPTRVTGIGGRSTDGSRVLLAGTTSGQCNVEQYPFECPYILGSPARLYMRVNNAATLEVSRGEEVNFVGMTRDASKVFFTTTEALDEVADTDTSRDLYMWEENGDKLTLISQEGALGNSDSCSSTWTTKCGVQALTPSAAQYSEFFDLVARMPGIDDVLANESGDIYFYSPEDLVPGEVGGDGERNLYLYRDGRLHFVTTFEPGTQVERSTISPNGSHAAFLTKSTLTAYGSQGKREVYAYSADSGALRCASCNPAGTAPIGDVVTVAEAGPFMANDGRTFFATKEGLVPQDTNGLRDIYEYVDGRAQLISTGTGDRDSTGGLEVFSIFFGNMQTGLESVSRDGTDVYFSTFDSLVPEDVNGSFLKMYDARTGGGFDFNPDLGACAAADECHGAGSSPPAIPQIRTGGTLGASGNLTAPKHKTRTKKKHRRRKKTKRHAKKTRRHTKHRGSRSNG